MACPAGPGSGIENDKPGGVDLERGSRKTMCVIRNRFRRGIAVLLTLGLFLSMLQVGNHDISHAAGTVRYPYGEESSSPEEGYVYLEVQGSYSQDSVEQILARVNEIRLEACREGVPYPSLKSDEPTGKTLTMDDYHPVKWSEFLQWVCQVRAAEANVYSSHDRPNNDPYLPKKEGKDVSSFFETLSYGTPTVLGGIEAWYSEKNQYIANDGLFLGYTGHYGAMINPDVEYIGMAAFNRVAAGEYSHKIYGHSEVVSEADCSVSGDLTQLVIAAVDNISAVYIRENARDITEKKLLAGETWQMDTVAKCGYSLFRIHSGASFESSDENVAVIDETGKVTALKSGSTTITAKISDDKKAEIELTVREIVSVQAPAKITVPSGTSPEDKLPEKVSVTWSDDTTTEENVVWSEIPEDYKNRKGGSFTIEGTLETYGKKTSQTVEVLPAVVTAISEPEGLSTASGFACELPKTLTVSWSNGDTSEEAVTWEAQDASLYGVTEGGTYTVSGTLLGKTAEAKVTVLPATILSVSEPEQVITTEGIAPVLPQEVSVTWSNKDTDTKRTVTWENVPKSRYEIPDRDFSVNGTITDFNGTKTPVTAFVHVVPKKPVSAAWVEGSPEGTVSYHAYSVEQLQGTIYVTYDNGTKEEKTVTPDMVTFDPESTEGTQAATVTYTEGESQLTLPLTLTLEKRTGLILLRLPDKTEYIEGEELDLSGLEFGFVYSDGTKETVVEITEPFVYGPYDANLIGEQRVEIRYGGFSAEFDVEVKRKSLTEIEVIHAPERTDYVTGQPMDIEDLDGLEVIAKYNNGTEETLDISKLSVSDDPESHDAGLSVTTQNIAGEQEIHVAYTDPYASRNIRRSIFRIRILERTVTGLTLVRQPDRTVYPRDDLGYDAFSGAMVHAVYNDGLYEEDLNVEPDMVTGFDLSLIGEQTVTITCGEKTVTFSAEVTEPVLTGRTLTPPEKTTIREGESFRLSGAKLTETYDNGHTTVIDLDQDPDLLEEKGIRLEFTDSEGGRYTKEEISKVPGSVKLLVLILSGEYEAGKPVYETLDLPDGSDITIVVEEKQKVTYKSEWVGGKWYDSKGRQKYIPTAKWRKNSKGWWYEDTSGWYPKNEWQKIDGVWYFFKADGYMASEEWVKGCYWLNKNGAWTYKNKASWKKDKTGWWFGDTSGWYAKKRWQTINGKRYYFNARGYLVTNRYVGNVYVGADGAAR